MSVPWYSEGLCFGCVPGCVRCCGGAPGDVFVTADESAAIAQFLGLERDAFEAAQVRHYSSGRASLVERANGDCVLLERTGCSVYPVRPRQCRTYPFWPEVVRSPASWQRESKRCPGLNSGRTYSAEEIDKFVVCP